MHDIMEFEMFLLNIDAVTEDILTNNLSSSMDQTLKKVNGKIGKVGEHLMNQGSSDGLASANVYQRLMPPLNHTLHKIQQSLQCLIIS